MLFPDALHGAGGVGGRLGGGEGGQGPVDGGHHWLDVLEHQGLVARQFERLFFVFQRKYDGAARRGLPSAGSGVGLLWAGGGAAGWRAVDDDGDVGGGGFLVGLLL